MNIFSIYLKHTKQKEFTEMKKMILISSLILFSTITNANSDVSMGMSQQEFREHINKIRAEQKGVEPEDISLPVENNDYIEVVVEKHGQPGERVVSSRLVSSEDSQYNMPNKTGKNISPNVNEDYTTSYGSDMFEDTGSTSNLGSRYAPPMEGLVNFANNTPWVHTDGEKEAVQREESETTGWFLFRQFRGMVERSAEQFDSISKQELDRTK